MSNHLTPFDFKGSEVRTLLIDDAPWFVATDVCSVLEIRNARDAVSSLDDDEVQVVPVGTADGSNRELPTNVINEPGLYSLILRSRKEEAKSFKRWVTHEVLPQIRKTGSYSAEVPSELELAKRYVLAIEAREAAKLALEAAEGERDEARKDLQDFLADDEWVSASEFANHLGIGRTTFFRMLRQHKIAFTDPQSDGNRIYQTFIDRGWAKAEWEPWANGKGHSWTPYFTRTGIANIRKILGA